MKKILIPILLFVTSFSFGQDIRPASVVKENVQKGESFQEHSLFRLNSRTSRSNLPQEVADYEMLTLQKEQLKIVLKESHKSLTLIIPSRLRNSIKLKLVEVPASSFPVVDASTNQALKYQAGKHYRGIIEGRENSIAAISIFEDEIMGLISDDNESGNLVIGKMAGGSEHIIYRDPEVVNKLGLECGVESNGVAYEVSDVRSNSGQDRALSDCVGIYFEVDNDIVTNKGGATGATNYVTGIYNQVATLYANENINTNISEVVVWTQTSPYSSSSSIGMLNGFTGYRQGFNGDLAMLLSYQASGGVAYVNGICSSNPDYSMGFASIGSSYSAVPTYSWTVMVVTHELGHLFGSQHTQACVWNGNGTAIDGCYPTEGSCARPGIPSGGGTIMSYCHLTSAGINLNLGFGSQPGNVIRSRVTNASCLQSCDSGGGGGGGGGTCTDNEAVLTLLTDNYPGETTWSILNSGGSTLYSGGPYSSRGATITETFCLPDGCFDFVINDTYGDGICCGYGQGSYSITASGNELASGGSFGSTESKNFCVGGSGNNPTCTDGEQNGNETGVDCGGPDCGPCVTPPNCNDGVQNGNETGVDCGGPDCGPCVTPPTCTDGVQNGNETGVDCGGPDCSPCVTPPTCTDGIQNGSETGVDCGGPDCSPCATCDDGQQNGNETGVDCGGPDCAPCNASETLVFGHYFESGWQGWQDGGSDCYRYGGSRSPEGQYSIRIRDNSGYRSTMTSSAYDLSSFTSIEINFSFYPYSMETGEDFNLSYFNGSQWIVLATAVSGTNFSNNTNYNATMTIANNQINFAPNARFRFTCDASTNSDQVYIDAVIVKGFSGAASLVKSGIEYRQISSTVEDYSEVRLSPNPAYDQVTIEIEADEEEQEDSPVEISIYAITGQIMKQLNFASSENQFITFNISDLPSGAYITRISRKDREPIVKKLQVLR